MKIVQEFKEFAIKGNVIDLAVGVIIGAAFGEIVKTLVDKVVMPPIGYVLSGVDFSDLSLKVGEKDGKPVLIEYGAFINSLIHFLIVAVVIFLVIKQFNRLRKKEAEMPPSTKKCPYCMEAISIEARKCSHCTADL